MEYFIDLFSPETYDAFARSPRDVSDSVSGTRTWYNESKPGMCLSAISPACLDGLGYSKL